VGNVLLITIRESENKPVQCREGFFWRQGASTQKLSRDEIRDFFRNESAIRFDLSICPKFRYPEDFDREKYAVWVGESRITPNSSIEDVLVNIEAAERVGGRLIFRNVGVLFFAKNVRHFFPQAYVTCLLAKGTDKVHILDRKDFDGGIVADIEDALRFIERNTRTAYRIERLKRENVSEYPMKALREAITNAVMHRDWFIEGANVFVEIYTDRIEVVSPGGLPKGMTLADLGRKSVRRNALVADLLHRIDFIEKAGTGIKRIRDDMRAQGCPEPEFEVNGFFTAIFRPNPGVRTQADTRVGAQSRAQLRAQSIQVLMALSESDKSAREVAEAIGLRSKTGALKRTLNELLAGGLIEYTLPEKPNNRLQRYRLTQGGREYLKKSEETK
jgi:ATP-dependent DNA helicase RecG